LSCINYSSDAHEQLGFERDKNMFKQVIFHALIGSAIALVAVAIHDGLKLRSLGMVLLMLAMGYTGITIVLTLAGVKLPSYLNMPAFLSLTSSDRRKKEARNELLEYKKLLDENILTKEEFDSKADELKKLIL